MGQVENMNLQERIAAARAKLENAKVETVKVNLGGEWTEIGFRRIAGHEWQMITKMHPPRKGTEDHNLGYNSDTLPSDYPVAAITVDGEPIDQETWREIYEVLTSLYRDAITSTLWSLNWLADFNEITKLGKASTGGEKTSP